MSKLTKIVVGFVSTFFLISIFGGGVQTAYQLYAFSIICTAGISLLLWVPLWFGVGSLVVASVTAMRQSIKGKTPEAEQKSKLTNDQKALTDYIHQSRSKGVNDDNIFSLLKSNGWEENAI